MSEETGLLKMQRENSELRTRNAGLKSHNRKLQKRLKSIEYAGEPTNRPSDIQTMGLNWKRRQFSLRERVFFEVWIEHNKRLHYVNHGGSSLDWLMNQTEQPISGFDRFYRPTRVTGRDEAVAMELMQYLGTSGGVAYLWEVHKRLMAEGDDTLKRLLSTLDPDKQGEALASRDRSLHSAVLLLVKYEAALREIIKKNTLRHEDGSVMSMGLFGEIAAAVLDKKETP